MKDGNWLRRARGHGCRTILPLLFSTRLTYLPVQSSPYWLVHSSSIGRFLLFGLLWLASFLVAHRLKGLTSPWIMVVLVAMSPALSGLLNNGSNALFAAMTGFALWQILAFHETRQIRHLWLCSTFVGLAALSRNEGPVLFVTFLGLSLLMCLRSWTLKRTLTAGLGAIAVPYMVLVVGFVAAQGLRTGDYSTGVAQRSYITFEQGHGMAFAESYGTLQPYVEGQHDAPRLFRDRGGKPTFGFAGDPAQPISIRRADPPPHQERLQVRGWDVRLAFRVLVFRAGGAWRVRAHSNAVLDAVGDPRALARVQHPLCSAVLSGRTSADAFSLRVFVGGSRRHWNPGQSGRPDGATDVVDRSRGAVPRWCGSLRQAERSARSPHRSAPWSVAHLDRERLLRCAPHNGRRTRPGVARACARRALRDRPHGSASARNSLLRNARRSTCGADFRRAPLSQRIRRVRYGPRT